MPMAADAGSFVWRLVSVPIAVYRRDGDDYTLVDQNDAAAASSLGITHIPAALAAELLGNRDGRQLVRFVPPDLVVVEALRNGTGTDDDSARLLSQLMQSSPLVLFEVDECGVFAQANGAGLGRADLNPADLVGRPALEVIGNSSAAGETRAARAVLERALSGQRAEMSLRMRDAHYRAQLVPTRTERGYRVTGVATDITDVARLEDRLRQAEKLEAVGRLAGGVAHDFNNLLTAILGNAELLAESVAADSALRGEIDGIRTAARSAAGLTSRLLAYSRKQPLQMMGIEVDGLIAAAEHMMGRLLREDVALEVSLGAPGLHVVADRAQLEHVVLNLAANARDAMPGGGTFRVSTWAEMLGEQVADLPTRPGRYIAIRAEDTGVGMRPDVLRRAFEPFFTTKAPGQGTGLGLASVYATAKQLGGYILLDSELGRGTTVTIYLPVGEKPESAAERISPPATSATGVQVSARLLVVEDDSAIRRLVALVLKRAGYDVHEARSPAHALDILAAVNPDVIVTDVVMPGMSGTEFVAAARQRGSRAKVLYVSGYAKKANIPEDVRLLPKPFASKDLVRAVEELLAAR